MPRPADPTTPRVAAICVYPDMVPAPRGAAPAAGVNVARVATAFPSGRPPRRQAADTADAVAAGADEIDMVIDRAPSCPADYLEVFDEIVAVK